MARRFTISACVISTVLLLLTACRPAAAPAVTGPSAVIELAKDADFDQALKDKGVVMVDFNATWCGPCQMIKPTIAALSNDYKGRLTVLSVDVDQHDSLASRFNIDSIPAILFFKDGELKTRLVGSRDREAYESEIRKLLPAEAVKPPATDSADSSQ